MGLNSHECDECAHMHFAQFHCIFELHGICLELKGINKAPDAMTLNPTSSHFIVVVTARVL